MIGRAKLVLASGSPRRVMLINQAGIEPDALRPADVDETPKRGELPRACANRLARAKAEAALELIRIDEEFRGSYVLSAEDIEAYLASGEWRGKAGGYAAQGIAGSFIVKIVGSYSNIVGLPLYETTTLLAGEGFPIHFGWLNAG